ncbi:MAG: chorismate mutase [Oscillospiraceae bacterium]|nr:chorismate mutase [Oscillospiraceae bacterium]
MDLQEYRAQIDKVDEDLLRLFKERMDISLGIAGYKKEHGLPALDAAREHAKLETIGDKAGDELKPYATKLFSMLFELSRSYQESVLKDK